MSKRLLADLQEYLRDRRGEAHRVLHRFIAAERPFWLRTELLDVLGELELETEDGEVASTPLGRCILLAQEATVEGSWLYLAVRPLVARWLALRIHVETMTSEEVGVSAYLACKERVAQGDAGQNHVLEVDLRPFNRDFYRLRESSSIGRGVEFLNRTLSSRLFEQLGKGDQRLLQFLRLHSYREQQLMLNGTIKNVSHLRRALREAVHGLEGVPPDSGWDIVAGELRAIGFEVGWGRNATRIRDMMSLLLDILEAPSPAAFEEFLGRIPMIFSIVILSPHGYFGQSNVLGRPDTGGQVVYILNQVGALEREMRTRLYEQGLEIDPQIIVVTRLIPEADGTTCDQRIEPVAGTEHAKILRVPFRTPDGNVVPHWISRFRVWPYLEQFAVDVEREVLAELNGRPDLIIGNYSDGNLVGTLLARSLGVTQCNIAHALEKTKYLYSDLFWRDNEANYHFSSQFTADVISMNAADFIITSTYQEIAGTSASVGQYESYRAFTMPGLFRVVSGIDVFDPKFNIVSPGADSEMFFPYSEQERRFHHLEKEIETLAFGDIDPEVARGVLAEPEKPVLFTMARLDHIKNITGFVEWFGRSRALREEANVFIISGHLDPGDSTDDEERGQIERMHELMDRFELDREVRWLGMHVDQSMAAEAFRFVASRRGAFVQPALFEAFGLTVVEAMCCGLPTFATCFGGPLEIIEDGISGFHLDPNHGDAAAAKMADFFARCHQDPEVWHRISKGGMERVEARYTWRRYAERMMTLSRIYGFWRYVSDLERAETRRYLEMFYSLQLRPLAASVNGQ